MARLDGPTRALIAGLGICTVAMAVFTLWDTSTTPVPAAAPKPVAAGAPAPAAAAPSPPAAVAMPPPAARAGRREVTVALSQWPGHLALVVGNGGLTTQAGSA